MFACEWVKDNWSDRSAQFELLVDDDDSVIVCVMADGTTKELMVCRGDIAELAPLPCVWIAEHWFDLEPEEFPCEWVKKHWEEP